ncbi:hypothetical protein A2U01_0045308 [Trifolium medium]|uniref:Uncharacterized protein n=1 Tax=Trifolium medium TaxID=97028 RepID=A0A392QLF7_9FABA|nr:hypothetical protein [Trifolium medium]
MLAFPMGSSFGLSELFSGELLSRLVLFRCRLFFGGCFDSVVMVRGCCGGQRSGGGCDGFVAGAVSMLLVSGWGDGGGRR